MRDLENYTIKEVIDNLIDNVCMDHEISRSQARKLVINALTYNVVADEIYSQIDWLLEEA